MPNWSLDNVSDIVIPSIGMLLSNLHVHVCIVSVVIVCLFKTELNMMLNKAMSNAGSAIPAVVIAPSKGLEERLI
jgi:hypothetical protein